MKSLYYVLIGAGVLVAILFSALVMITGKGDAMSGGGGVRTTFKGKANFDDIMSKWTLYLGISFMAIALVVDVLGQRLFVH
ncbi:MAG TPA: preprotein translocase subunit SecG [Fimbriimonas sp.]|nr:preprotein translocase subunit SecG [Fimbriimonas sp.]